MPAGARWEQIATVIVVCAAVAVAAANIHREFVPQRATTAALIWSPPTYQRDWRTLASTGILMGDSSARIQIVEFADFECPFCRMFNEKLQHLRKTYGRDLAVTFVHFPLSMHRFARAAARAAECADVQGRFVAFQDLLYQKQDSFGMKPWTAYAKEAGVPDTIRFGRCVVDTARVARIENGLARGKAMGIVATPSVFLNGWKYLHFPIDSLTDLVARVAAGKPLLVGTAKK